mmetsp:Transcript_1911/g.11762  ORF Transcript_1911/g.11762 Transcript_1911/m.11762 type:complete len:252 (+) Transcript_1911:1587-2342(+)
MSLLCSERAFSSRTIHGSAGRCAPFLFPLLGGQMRSSSTCMRIFSLYVSIHCSPFHVFFVPCRLDPWDDRRWVWNQMVPCHTNFTTTIRHARVATAARPLLAWCDDVLRSQVVAMFLTDASDAGRRGRRADRRRQCRTFGITRQRGGRVEWMDSAPVAIHGTRHAHGSPEAILLRHPFWTRRGDGGRNRKWQDLGLPHAACGSSPRCRSRRASFSCALSKPCTCQSGVGSRQTSGQVHRGSVGCPASGPSP